MPRGKSVLVNMKITTVGRAHSCRFNKNHRLEKGMKRLTFKENGDEAHYCLPCGKPFLTKGLKDLQSLIMEVDRIMTDH